MSVGQTLDPIPSSIRTDLMVSPEQKKGLSRASLVCARVQNKKNPSAALLIYYRHHQTKAIRVEIGKEKERKREKRKVKRSKKENLTAPQATKIPNF